MKFQLFRAGLAFMLSTSVQAITVTPPDKGISLDQQDSAQSKQPSSQLAPSSRGELLYLNHCLECHESNVHIRNTQKAETINAIRDEVTRWAKEIKLKWTLRDIEDVADYLNTRYYHYSE